MNFDSHDLTESRRAGNSATYCPEDNKLRLYCGRVERATYDELRRLKFVSSPKQDCDFVATWSATREDACLALIPDDDDIGDEDYSPEERAADRAERFGVYRDKRRGEAGGHADAYESGPDAFGYQSQAKADRAADRHERHRGRALSQWSKAEYWQERTAGVIRHALCKSSARVRRGRILTLEAEQRKHDSIRNANGVNYSRWSDHLANRLNYENAMLENEGGMAAAVEIEPGGFIGEHQVHKVNKSPATGRVVSVLVRGAWGYTSVGGRRVYVDHANAAGFAKMNIERLGEDAYRPPTEEERAAFAEQQKQAKAKAKGKPKAPSLVNPTDEDAERLQAVLNDRGRAKHEADPDRKYTRDFQPAEVFRMTQAQYSAASKGTYSKFDTRTLHNGGGVIARMKSNMWSSHGKAYDDAMGAAVCKVRTASPRGYSGYTPQRIVIITDKPQKPLPLDWAAIESGVAVTA